MQIPKIREKLICPKCKEEGESFSGLCDNCNRKLIRKEYISFFNSEGDYINKCDNLDLDKSSLEEIYSKVKKAIMEYDACYKESNYAVKNIIEVLGEDDLNQPIKLNSYFILVGYNGEGDCELLKVKLYSSSNRLDEIKFNSLNNNDLLRKTTSTTESIVEFLYKEHFTKVIKCGLVNEYELYYKLIANRAYCLNEIPKNILNEEICSLAVEKEGLDLRYVPDELKSEEICRKAVKNNRNAIMYVPQDKKAVLGNI